MWVSEIKIQVLRIRTVLYFIKNYKYNDLYLKLMYSFGYYTTCDILFKTTTSVAMYKNTID